MSSIKKGFNIFITSWENDGDNYNTKLVTVDTGDQVRDVLSFCKLFRSKNGRPAGIGNIYDDGEEMIEAATQENKELLSRVHQIIFEDDCEDYDGVLLDLAYELGLSGSEFITRVFKTFKVVFISQYEDMTGDFT